ncbi:cytochrome b5 [Metschnikowia bicuspidata var. bicuspidata NRRL YB-4993]|uniref:Cytochrome b5 n=1 Tax=Metschnikowia bicuspidata var. bicuspidata NRRL YB-4993 TaxID=869754 RepID=A0A1A0H8S0_9ASCO|nr:cytochrome b5 [Metschnikowia bicuspidata var. bicuspidata NRRL YB-4993]OBA20395.1 cytochrome b5 [Metschnikowia bicuspidata var. bicuspidata NRRL YB-4993]
MSDTTELKVYTSEQVKEHNTAEDLWIVYNGHVYDVTKYLDEHPGGEEVIVDCAGEDATEAFDDIGHSDDAHEILKDLLIGKLEGGAVKPAKGASSSSGQTEASSVPVPLIAAAIFAVFAGVYFYMK